MEQVVCDNCGAILYGEVQDAEASNICYWCEMAKEMSEEQSEAQSDDRAGACERRGASVFGCNCPTCKYWRRRNGW